MSSMERNWRSVSSKKNIIIDGSMCCGQSLVSKILLGNAELIALVGLWKPIARTRRFVAWRHSNSSSNNDDVAGERS